MSGRNIDSLSIFGEYTQKENRLTAALLHILNVGNEPLIRFIVEKLNKELPSNEILITTQQKEDFSVPDGTLECSFKFKICIESKIKPNSIDKRQLENHLKLVEKDEDTILLYITLDLEKPEILGNDVAWANWTNILNWLEEYIQKNKLDVGHRLYYLYENFGIFLLNENLLTEEWNWEKNNRVVIFGGGKFGEEAAFRFGKYFCQNYRSIKPSGYISFYRDWRITYCYKIIEPPKDDQNLLEIPELLSYFKERNVLEKEYENLIASKLFNLGIPVKINEIKNDKKNENDDPIPFLYGNQRYTTIEKLKKAKFTSELL